MTSIQPFGIGADGQQIDRISISGGGLTASVLTRGAILQDLRMDGVEHGLTLGSSDLAAYEGPMASFGAIVAPVVNRIRDARATIRGQEYRFEANQAGRHVVHSGLTGSHRQVWQIDDASADTVTLSIDLPDGQGGFPGNKRVTARYMMAGDGTLRLEISASTDAPTLMNIAHHGYWNLGNRPDWNGHRLRIAAEQVLEADADVLPTGTLLDVAGTGFDFRAETEITPGRTVRLDHNFCLAAGRRDLTPILWLTGPDGLTLELASTEPGLQVYDGGAINSGEFSGVDGLPYRAFCGLALEPQFWPDAPNQPHFPDINLSPGEDWLQVTEFRFGRD